MALRAVARGSFSRRLVEVSVWIMFLPPFWQTVKGQARRIPIEIKVREAPRLDCFPRVGKSNIRAYRAGPDSGCSRIRELESPDASPLGGQILDTMSQ